MKIFTQTVLAVGRVTPQGVTLLGTGFLVADDGRVVTTRHVVGNDESGLCVLFPRIEDLNAYQDTTDTSCKPVPTRIIEVDPLRDLAILRTDLRFSGQLPPLGSFDETNVGDALSILGFPHAPEGRWVLTLQNAIVGAKVLLGSQGLTFKHAIINTQARPGQSGSLIFAPKTQRVVGVLVGAYAALTGRRRHHWWVGPTRTASDHALPVSGIRSGDVVTSPEAPTLPVPDEPVENWLDALKPYQRAHLASLLAGGKSPEQTAEAWLSATGVEGTIGFGGVRDSKPFLDRFKAEFKKFVC